MGSRKNEVSGVMEPDHRWLCPDLPGPGPRPVRYRDSGTMGFGWALGFIWAGDDDQVQVSRYVVEQEGESLVDGLSGNDVVVVEDEDKRVGNPYDLIDQYCQKRLL